jgi:hypothetical protein
MASSDKDIRKLEKALIRQGWRVEWPSSGANHGKAYSPDGKHIVVLSGTPGKGRAFQNQLAQLKRCGFRPDG